MSIPDSIWKHARTDWLVTNEAGKPDQVFWERAERLARLALSIADYPEIASLRVDRNALLAAALYHDAGWIVQWRRKEIDRSMIRARPAGDIQRQLSTELMKKSLGNVLMHGSLDTAVMTVLECGQKHPMRPESRLLNEALNLDDIGLQAICQMAYRQCFEGGGLTSLLHAWDRQCEYHFWEARIAECLHYEATKKLARARLASMRLFMDELRKCQHVTDVAEVFRATSTGGVIGHSEPTLTAS